MPVFATDRKVEAVAYELAEQFFKRVGGGQFTLQEVDDLSVVLHDAIDKWLRLKEERPSGG